MVEKFRRLSLLYCMYVLTTDMLIFGYFQISPQKTAQNVRLQSQISRYRLKFGGGRTFFLYSTHRTSFAKKVYFGMQHLKKKFFKYVRNKILKKKLRKKRVALNPFTQYFQKPKSKTLVHLYYLCAPYLCIIFNFFAPHCGPKI